MALLDIVKEAVTDKPARLRLPYFAKADSDLKAQLEFLTEFYARAPESVKPKVEQDIRSLEADRVGEENIASELWNSIMPIIVLHDLNLEYDGQKAQIDFMVISTKVTLIIECKNLYGDIEVNGNGNFIRTTTFSGITKRERIENPIDQNAKHLEIIKAVRRATFGNSLFRAVFDKTFNDNYKSVVVLANPQTELNLKYAKKEMRDQIIRYDQLVAHLKSLYETSKNTAQSDKRMFARADFFIGLHNPKHTDYLKKYGNLFKTAPMTGETTTAKLDRTIEQRTLTR